MIMCEAQYCAKTCEFTSRYVHCYFASSRGGCDCVTRRDFAQSHVKIINARQFKGAYERCVKAALEDPAHSRAISRLSMVNTFEV